MDDLGTIEVVIGVVLTILSFGAGIGWRAGRWRTQQGQLAEQQQAAQDRIALVQGQLAETVTQVQAVVSRLDDVVERELGYLRGSVDALGRTDKRLDADLDQVIGALELAVSHVELDPETRRSITAKLHGARRRDEVTGVLPVARAMA